ncbi:TadE family protein [Demequina maris]|uniref:TadE family protein n=1 Tax=Demequina maris TaxID=1638982 RepID=UPI000ABB2E19|nr:TadE family protein [Demequina maris]
MSARGDRGSATVELALALPAAVAVLAAALSAVQAAAAGVAVPAAALAGARAGAVAGDEDAVAAAHRAAGGEATVEVSRANGWVTVTVAVDLGWPWGARTARAALPSEAS